MGFLNDDELLAKTISDNNNIPLSFITEALHNIPVLNNDIIQINLGITEEMEKTLPPDLFIIYMKPSQLMTMMHLYSVYRIQPVISTYSMLSMCGNVFANSYINKAISISFGCPDSRKYGDVYDNELVIGITYQLAKYLTA